MLGVIGKVLGLCVLAIVAIVLVLNYTGVYKWGTVGFRTPDVAACDQMAQGFKAKPLLTAVRWSWVQDQRPSGTDDEEGLTYGWACHFEFGDDSKADISYPRTAKPTN